jgi:YidC/Oxa1 family membrane protein insertase
MSLEMPGGKSIKQTYALENTGYLVNHSVSLLGMQNDIPKRNTYLDLNWESKIFKVEKDSAISAHATTVFYKKKEESPSNLSETKDAEEKFKDKTEWVSFKQQFFCQTLISSKLPFINAELSTQTPLGTNYQKALTAQLTLPYNHAAVQQYDMQFYYGPLHYKTLKGIGMDMEKQIPLGWFLFNIVNRFIIIPVFSFLSTFISNYGIIIFLLTIFIKLIVTPLTYKSYVSTAKMRVLKPELDELKAKYGEDMTQLQQEQMKLYRKAGVSPFGGCLPLILQFPFLIAMFRFFPASIELRQEHFLWAHDLSTYDSIYTLPFHIPAYGNHVSLFTLLMTVSTLIYTRMNNSLSPQQNEFKWMSYLMPIFFLGFFNNYAAGLSLYYFYFNILTFLQQYLFKVFVNDKKLMAIIEENKKKPRAEKKGGFQKRLADLAAKQQEMQKNKAPKPPRRK